MNTNMTKVEDYLGIPIYWDESKGQFFCLSKYFTNKTRAINHITHNALTEDDYKKMRANDD